MTFEAFLGVRPFEASTSDAAAPRWTYVAAGLGIVGFVLIARTEPSVVRAAAMGTVALIV